MIELKNVSKHFGGIKAVENVSLNIREGSITGLIGPNGAGKTTLFNIIAGFYTPDSGEIRFEGNNISGLRSDELFQRGILRTFQIAHEFDNLTVRENLLVHGLKINSLNLGLLEKLNLKRHIDNSVGTLSFGQQKKLSLIRILNAKERIIILDEPFVGLDEESKNILREFMDSIKKENRTLIFTSHIDLEDNYREIKIDD